MSGLSLLRAAHLADACKDPSRPHCPSLLRESRQASGGAGASPPGSQVPSPVWRGHTVMTELWVILLSVGYKGTT